MNKAFITLMVVSICGGHVLAQVPGDGIPDVYLFWRPAITTVNSSVGPVSRPFGTVLLDTDGNDVVAELLEGPDLTNSPDNGNYLTGATAYLPDPHFPPFFASSWVDGYINGQSQFIRTSPLDTEGFVGVIGEYDDPIGFFPNLGLGHFDGCPSDFGNITIATNAGQVFSTADGTMGHVGPILLGGPPCVPEPSSLSLVLIGLLATRVCLVRIPGAMPTLLYTSRKRDGPTAKDG